MSAELSLPSSGYSAELAVFPLATHPTSETIKVISSYLNHLTANSDSSPVKGDLTRFHARTIPTIDILAYLQRILKYAPCGNEVFLAVLVYFERIARRADVLLETQDKSLPSVHSNSTGSLLGVEERGDIAEFTMSKKRKKKVLIINSFNVHRLLITGVMIASKLFSDVFFLNSHYAKVGGLPVQELNQLEIEFLIFTDFNLHITVEQLQETGNRLLRHSSTIRSVSESFQARLVIKDESGDIASRQAGRPTGGSERGGPVERPNQSNSSIGRGGMDNGSTGGSQGRLSNLASGGSVAAPAPAVRDYGGFNNLGGSQRGHSNYAGATAYSFTDFPQTTYYSPGMTSLPTTFIHPQPHLQQSQDQGQTAAFSYAPTPPHHQYKLSTNQDGTQYYTGTQAGRHAASTSAQTIPVMHQHSRYQTPPPSHPSEKNISMQFADAPSGDDAIRGTNEDATISRLSAANLGYIHDPFVKYFVRRPTSTERRRSPLINRGTYLRAKGLDAIIDSFLDHEEAEIPGESGEENSIRSIRQILVLGAGSETRWWRLQEQGKQPTRYFEIDFPEITGRKIAIIQKNDMLSKPLGAIEVECVLVYLEPKTANSIIDWLGRHLEVAVFVTYEQILPHDAFGQMMIQNLQSRGIELPGLQAFPDLTSQRHRYESLGWSDSIALDLDDYYAQHISFSEKKRVQHGSLSPLHESVRKDSAGLIAIGGQISDPTGTHEQDDEESFAGKGKGKGKAISYLAVDDAVRESVTSKTSNGLAAQDRVLIEQFSGPTRRAAELFLDWRDRLNQVRHVTEDASVYLDADDVQTVFYSNEAGAGVDHHSHVSYVDPVDHRSVFLDRRGFQDISDVDTAVDAMSVDEISSVEAVIGPRAHSGVQSLNIGDMVPVVSVSLATAIEELPFGREWLLRFGKNCKCLSMTHGEEAATIVSPIQLCIDVFTILRSESPDDEIQLSLVELLGFDNMEFVTELVSRRTEVVERVMAKAPDDALERRTPSPGPDSFDAPSPFSARPIFGAQVTIKTESEKIAVKQARKEAKRKAREERDGESEEHVSAKILGFTRDAMDGDMWRRLREEELRNARLAPPLPGTASPRDPSEIYPHIYKSNYRDPPTAIPSKFSLPEGTERVNEKQFESISIPIARQAPVRVHERTIELDELDSVDRKAFKGYRSFNRVQSIVFETAYKSNENMLVSAPTGAGKTDIAMLCVLHTIGQFRTGTSIALSDFKIVYVAPMKALAAEIVRKFSSRIGQGSLGIQVRELTGDMQLTKNEITNTQMIVTTPEKWDVVTRKSVGDTELVESSQSFIRLLGLSATLPNYVDVGEFLRVNPYKGLFFFDAGFRPVPLAQTFIGVKAKPGSKQSSAIMDSLTYSKVVDLVKMEKQVMVFVHARKATVSTAMELRNMSDPKYITALKEVQRSRNKELVELFGQGFGIHHAGMLRADRTLTENLFREGLIKVLVCTATLAWGVNLPAYAVIIKGTQVYSAQKGTFVDLSILDVLQIFGRAGRPQYEDHGQGYIVTTHDKLSHYVTAITQQFPIESKFIESLEDNLNAEISLGTVTNVDEAVNWLGYTFLHIRMRKNPLNYGMKHDDVLHDPLLGKRRHDLIVSSAKRLSKAQMIVFDENTGYFTPKDLGRIASNFYIRLASVETFNDLMTPRMTEADILSMVSMSSEFENVKVREEEMPELKGLEEASVCAVKGGVDTTYGKVNILLQNYVSRSRVDDFALVSDTGYVAQNSARILRALFEVALNRNWGPAASRILSLSKSVDKRLWSFEHPLSQFDLPVDVIKKLEAKPNGSSIDILREMDSAELGAWIRHMKMGKTVQKCIQEFPQLILEARVAPITRTVLKVDLDVTPDFLWSDRAHGSNEAFWIWVEDAEHTEILHSEYLLISKKQARETAKLSFTIPLPKTSSTSDELPPQIFIRAVSDRWVGSENAIAVSFKHLILPQMQRTPHTDLLNLQPLPIAALQDEVLEEICRPRFSFFNAIQTQIFHTLYYSQHNTLVGAPTGSGKTVAAELAMWNAFREAPSSKVVYIAPLKALVRERVTDWNSRLMHPMGRKLVELTGDVTPDMHTIQSADVIVTTPEKWDGVSRSWQSRGYVQSVSLVIIDEIHLLGGDRGPVLEVIVSRLNYISAHTDKPIRLVGLSTALANANDLADWLGIKDVGMFNFKHSVRPVPLEIHIDGFAGKFYCPRMQSMNKPTYKAIRTHSPTKPVIVFVSSRRQTRLTAQDLISLCANDDNPRMFLHMEESEMEMIVSQIRDPALRYSLSYGIGLHHAGLIDSDRRSVEELFVNNKIQVLIATSTLAWGINTPAHLVVVKGTEFFDPKQKGYVDFPITDVLQMVGRAGRPQFDDSAVARVFVQDAKKNFYKKFLFEPFPVESSLHLHMHDHLNAEIVAGTIKSKQDALEYLTWTYFYRRLRMNPTYYGLPDNTQQSLDEFMSDIIERTVGDLHESGCVEIKDSLYLRSTTLGYICSYYYLSYQTMRIFKTRILESYPSTERAGTLPLLMRVLCDSAEYAEIPVRHNEDVMNKEFEKQLPIRVGSQYDSPHVKAFLLLEAHMERLQILPCADYVTDSKTVLDSSVRIIQAMIDVAADQGFLATSLSIMNLLQCIKQGRWLTDNTLLTLPHMEPQMLTHLRTNSNQRIDCLAQLVTMSEQDAFDTLQRVPGINTTLARKIADVVMSMPLLDVDILLSSKGAGQISKYHLQVVSGAEVHVRVSLERLRRHKEKYEGYWLVVGEMETDDLVALKRFAPQRDDIHKGPSPSLSFTPAPEPGRYTFTLFIISDGYLGLDQQLEFTVEVL
ncbi:activating signal cointegrator 1 complex subunit [Gonapodya sp. JEL0774]|nr:activating signal cointegrator 1 complex subunit [Gonapodya sp. JEL0774]